MSKYEININLDAKCVRCGKGGATQSGVCLKCMAKAVTNGELDHVIERIRNETAKQINSQETGEIEDYPHGEKCNCSKCISDRLNKAINMDCASCKKKYAQEIKEKLEELAFNWNTGNAIFVMDRDKWQKFWQGII